jgi:hypothetical protein
MNTPMSTTVEWTMKRRRAPGLTPAEQIVADQQRIPRIARLMALAIKFDALIRDGAVRDYADLARLGHVSRARITQIMNLLNLAPVIQEAILHSRDNHEREIIPERNIRELASLIRWNEQLNLWKRFLETAPKCI